MLGSVRLILLPGLLQLGFGGGRWWLISRAEGFIPRMTSPPLSSMRWSIGRGITSMATDRRAALLSRADRRKRLPRLSEYPATVKEVATLQERGERPLGTRHFNEDAWVVSHKHPLGMEAGTPEARFNALVREYRRRSAG